MKFETEIEGRAGKITIDGNRFRYERAGGEAIERTFSIEPLDSGAWSVLVEGRNYAVTRGSNDVTNGSEVHVNGRRFSVDVFDPRALRARKNAAGGSGRQNMVALMPGKVVRVLVAAGDEVDAGQGLVVVEAMKMQNEMKAPRSGRIAEVRTCSGATVAAGEILIVIE